MKYLVILGDGMADHPVADLGGHTPLQYAATPIMDSLAAKGSVGAVHTVPAGLQPGSDVANMAILGCDPRQYYTGRAPLEALSMGIPMEDGDVALRCNFVTVSEEEAYEDKILLDHSAGEISTEEANILLDALRTALASPDISFYTGVRYRHICRWRCDSVPKLAAPYDHLSQRIGAHLPPSGYLREMMVRSFEILNDHPLNLQRAKAGLPKANSIWFWGAGKKVQLPSFEGRTGLKGAMISGVDLLKGIGAGMELDVVTVPGATGGADTDYEAKAKAAVDALCRDGRDFVFVHVEAPDEMGHRGDALGKVRVIEDIDRRLLGAICRELDAEAVDHRLLLLPDHPTPVHLRCHTAEAVPFLLYDSRYLRENPVAFTEKAAAVAEDIIPDGSSLLNLLLES